ncbi:MAG TPA: Mut7-C RNAse domain-containing protein [Terriglobales bacterium]|nr:Mut7-C RNAse domain-containing protein [Terriglobales bacterium]
MPPTRFVTDSSLAHLARRLRFLGYDVVTLRGARLEEVMAAARRDERTVLTLSARRPRRWADVPVIGIERGNEAPALRMLASSCEPAGAPFSRCGECNALLEPRHAIEARGEVPARVLRRGSPLRYCPGCGRWYWDGSHVRHIRAWLESALGRPLGDAPPAP